MFRLLLICSLLAGCESFATPFVPEFDRGPDVPIKYEYVKDGFEMSALCPTKPGSVTLGCAFIPASADGVCVVVLFRGDEETKRHEEKHCRYGRWHL